MICPKCHYEKQEHDADLHPGICPACGIAYIKWQESQTAPQLAPGAAFTTEGPQATDSGTQALCIPVETLWQRAHHYTCFMPSDGSIAAFWAHIALYICFLLWGWSFILHGVDWLWIGSSVLHPINLPFHEYGHIMFSPFGTFWLYLGGSLFQILLPLIPLGYFMVWQRDNFAASMMLWWSGQNFIDVSPYIADAPVRAIALISGDDDSHDWWNLLSMTDSLDAAGFYAGLCFLLGTAVILLSNGWGAYLLWIEFHSRTQPDAVPDDLPPEL